MLRKRQIFKSSDEWGSTGTIQWMGNSRIKHLKTSLSLSYVVQHFKGGSSADFPVVTGSNGL